MGEVVSFKGNKDGIVLLLDCSVEFEPLCQMVVQKLRQSSGFLGEHATLSVNSGNVCLTGGQQLALKILLQSLGHNISYFVPEATEPTNQEKPVVVPKKTVAPPQRPEKPVVKAEPKKEPVKPVVQADLLDVEHYLADGALAVRKNVRSGQKISFDGTLVIFGDVNAGAELVATGHILVLGTLRGVAHAGCQGNKSAIIYATQLNSLQLRIADLIARAPDGDVQERRSPEIARIAEDRLIIEEI